MYKIFSDRGQTHTSFEVNLLQSQYLQATSLGYNTLKYLSSSLGDLIIYYDNLFHTYLLLKKTNSKTDKSSMIKSFKSFQDWEGK